MAWCIFHLAYTYIKLNYLCHLVFQQLMTCEWFPKDLNKFWNFKFASKFALIHVNIVSLQIQILLC
jgi:hypothetical protein